MGIAFKGYGKKLVITTAAFGQLAFVPPLPVYASTSVKIAGSQAFVVPAGAGSMSADKRAETMQRNIDNALVASTNHGPSAVGITYVSGQPIITLGGFYVCTVDSATAQKLGLSSSVLAQRWANGLKSSLSDKAGVEQYVAHLSGSTSAQAGTATTNAGSYPYYQQGRVVYVPKGMMLPVTLKTGITSESAKTGDRIEALLSEDVQLGSYSLPANSTLMGQVTSAVPGARLGKSGTLGIKFNKLRTPDGAEIPITAHIIGGIGKYSEIAPETDLYKGETTGTKIEKAAIHGAIGGGAGAILGTAVGAIAGHGRGAGRGAWSGLALGTAIGVGESLLYRKGNDVKVASGDALKLELDAPITISSSNM